MYYENNSTHTKIYGIHGMIDDNYIVLNTSVSDDVHAIEESNRHIYGYHEGKEIPARQDRGLADRILHHPM